MILTIINVIAALVTLASAVFIFILANSFGELVVRWVEENQNYFKKTNTIVDQISRIGSDLRKSLGTINELKRINSRLQESIRDVDTSVKTDLAKLATELNKLSSENSKLSSNINKIKKE